MGQSHRKLRKDESDGGDESFENGGRCREESEWLFSRVLRRASVTNRLREPPASSVPQRCHWPSQWARGQAVTLSR